MSAAEHEPGQCCYESYRRAAADGAAWPLWGALDWWQREGWRKQEAVEAWRAAAKPLEGGSHEADHHQPGQL